MDSFLAKGCCSSQLLSWDGQYQDLYVFAKEWLPLRPSMMIVNRIPTIHLMTFYCVLHVLELTIFDILQVRNLMRIATHIIVTTCYIWLVCLWMICTCRNLGKY